MSFGTLNQELVGKCERVKSFVVGKVAQNLFVYVFRCGCDNDLEYRTNRTKWQNLESRDEMIECKPPKCSGADGSSKHSEPEYTYLGLLNQSAPACRWWHIQERTDPKFPKEVASVTNTQTVFRKVVTFSVFFVKMTMVSKMIFSVYCDVISKRPAVAMR